MTRLRPEREAILLARIGLPTHTEHAPDAAQRQRYDRYVRWQQANHPTDPVPTFPEWARAAGEDDQ